MFKGRKAPMKRGQKSQREMEIAATLQNPVGEDDMPQKRYRKKKKKGEEESTSQKSSKKKKVIEIDKKKKIIEIDGQLYALDENGHPSKKLRKKVPKAGEKIKRSASQGPPSAARGRQTVAPDGKIRRAKSLGRRRTEEDEERGKNMGAERPNGMKPAQTQKVKPRTWIDQKGRKHIIEEDGSELIIDKTGKKMRKKVKPPVVVDDDSVYSEGVGDGSGTSDLKISIKGGGSGGFFDKLWDDGSGSGSKTPNSPGVRTNTNNGLDGINEEENSGDDIGDNQAQGRRDSTASVSLSAKISEVGRENQELQLKLQEAEEEIQNITDQNRKEKSKSFKVTAEMMQLKADFTEASSDVQKLRTKVKDLQLTLDTKELQIAQMSEGGTKNGSPVPASPRRSLMGGWRARHQDDMAGEEKKNERVDDSGGGKCSACGRESNTEVEDLLAETRALQRKLEFEKQSRQHDLKKKDDKLVFLTTEIAELREELEMIIKGEKPGTKVNPTMIRLLNEKKKIQAKYEQEKEVTSIRIEGMQEMIESLQKINDDLKKQLTMEAKTADALGGSDESLDLNDLGGGQYINKSAPQTDSEPDPNASLTGLWSKFTGR